MTWYPIFDVATGFWMQLAVLSVALCVSVVKETRSRRRRRMHAAALTLVAIVLFRLGGFLLKNALHIPRPCWNPVTPSLISCPESFSFPSGHALGIAMIATFFAFAFRHPRVWIIATGMTIVIAASRVFFGVHTPLDVLGGVILGSVFGWFTWKIFWYD